MSARGARAKGRTCCTNVWCVRAHAVRKRPRGSRRVNIRGPVPTLVSVNKTEAEWAKEKMVETIDPFFAFWHEGEGCKKLFAMHPLGPLGPYLRQILPKHKWRTHAQLYLDGLDLPAPTTSVHARRFEGQCFDRFNTGMLLCRNPAAMKGVRVPELMGACNMTTDYINVDRAVVLSDGQFWTHSRYGKGRWPSGSKDGTLQGWPDGVSDQMYLAQHPGWILSKNKFWMDIWVMILTDEYWGNPASSIGFVMSNWRGSRPTLPKKCYEEPEGPLVYPGWTWKWKDQDVMLKPK